MIEQVYTDEQLDAMSQDELKAEYERVMNFGKYYGKPDYFHWKRFERLIRRYESLILRAEVQMKYKMCITCKHYVHEIDKPSKGAYIAPYCKLDPEQVVYLFTECLIGKWEAKDEPA